MIKVVKEHGIFKPVAICDHCGNVIEDASKGNYYFNMEADVSDILVGHKECDRQMEFRLNKRDGEFWGYEQLDMLPLFLARNMGINAKPTTESQKQHLEFVSMFNSMFR